MKAGANWPRVTPLRPRAGTRVERLRSYESARRRPRASRHLRGTGRDHRRPPKLGCAQVTVRGRGLDGDLRLANLDSHQPHQVRQADRGVPDLGTDPPAACTWISASPSPTTGMSASSPASTCSAESYGCRVVAFIEASRLSTARGMARNSVEVGWPQRDPGEDCARPRPRWQAGVRHPAGEAERP
jgi:hypothetical protein